MTSEDGTTYLTEGEAKECLHLIKECTDRRFGPGWEPALYPPGHEGEFWNVSLEGLEDWAMRVDEVVAWPPGVYAEPIYSWGIALYRAT